MKAFQVSPVRLAIVIALLAALAGCQTEYEWPAVDPEAIAAGRELLAVFETGEPARFEDYLKSRTDFDVSDWLIADTRRLIYDGEALRRFRPRLRSITDIIALGEIDIFGALQFDGSIVLHFVPRRYRQDADRLEFYSDEWMRKYFACRFEQVAGSWRLARHICFSETDGPYPLEMAGRTEEQGPGLSVAVRR